MVGIFASVAIRHFRADAEAKKERGKEEGRQAAWRTITPRMGSAEDEARKAIETRIQDVRAFFAERQKRVPSYAARVFSLRSKWELGKSKLPLTDKDAHTRFLKEEFSKLVFSESEIAQVVTGAVENYVRDVQAIENALLVRIRADLQDTPGGASALPELKTDALFSTHFGKIIGGLSEKTGTDAKVDVSRMIGSEIAAAIAVRVGLAVATRLGVSGTIVGAGAAAGPETLGLSVVAGLVIDQIAGWVIGWFYKPEEEIGKKLNEELARLSVLIIDGDEKTRGLKQELGALAERRNSLRAEALRKMILQPVP